MTIRDKNIEFGNLCVSSRDAYINGCVLKREIIVLVKAAARASAIS
jgi:hypothetical protein